MKPVARLLLCFSISSPVVVHAQTEAGQPYSRKNTFAVFGEYSNDSSRIVMGDTPNRKIGAIGLQYERKVFESRTAVLQYLLEWRPVILESDPTLIDVFTVLTPSGYPPSTSRMTVVRCVPRDSTFRVRAGHRRSAPHHIKAVAEI